jgi:hypothetical protein
VNVNAGSGDRAPVYVDGKIVSHAAAFYLRTLGKWTLENPTAPGIFSSLYVKPRPVLISPASYYGFDQWLTRRKAAGAGEDHIDAGALAAAGRLFDLPTVMLVDELLILPGPYGACAPEADPNWRR